MLQTAFLLVIGQAVFGLIGYLTRSLPWAGLALTVLFIWFVVRTAKVVRGELPRREALRGRAIPFPWGLLAAAVLWQLPTLAAVPFWTPLWASQIWQGALLPVPGSIGLWQPAVAAAAFPWLWLAFLAEIVLFVWVAGRSEPSFMLKPQAVPVKAAPGGAKGEWAPAKQFRSGLGKRRPDLFGAGDDAK
ncbi:MAG TPA: hypothetical protein VGK74_20910 [Symbiobacteriaceae bacterium]|jgi:hypothetical protein